MKIKIISLLFLSIMSGVFAQGKKKPVVIKKSTTKYTVSKTVKPLAIPKEGIFADIETSKGKIGVVLEYKKTPITVANFISLAEGKNTYIVEDRLKNKPFYDGLKFHRVIKDFMIQGGDPAGNGQGGPGYNFKDEFDPTLVHDQGGILSMANSGPTTNGSQFFITHKETPWLNGKHTIFGHSVTGMAVINAIAQDDVIKSVKIIRKGADAKAFDAVKVFNDYYANKADDDKKQAALLAENKKKQEAAQAEAKKIYLEKYGPIVSKKAAELAKLKTSATVSSTGLGNVIVKKGTKKPADGSTVYFYYAGYLEDGTMFDSNFVEVAKEFGKYDANRETQGGYAPFPFKVGNKEGMIPGFIEAMNQMQIDEKSTVFIPSKLGYAERGAGNVIPPNSNIIFEIEIKETAPAKIPATPATPEVKK